MQRVHSVHFLRNFLCDHVVSISHSLFSCSSHDPPCSSFSVAGVIAITNSYSLRGTVFNFTETLTGGFKGSLGRLRPTVREVDGLVGQFMADFKAKDLSGLDTLRAETDSLESSFLSINSSLTNVDTRRGYVNGTYSCVPCSSIAESSTEAANEVASVTIPDPDVGGVNITQALGPVVRNVLPIIEQMGQVFIGMNTSVHSSRSSIDQFGLYG